MIKQFHNEVTDDQLEQLAPLLSEDDQREIRALGWQSCHQALRSSVASSAFTTYFTLNDGTPAGIAGVVPDAEQIGCVWLLTTDAVRQAPLAFVRAARYWLNALSAQYVMLHNIADPRNTTHMKLLKHLGFKRLGFVPVGSRKHTFVEFAKLLPCASLPR